MHIEHIFETITYITKKKKTSKLVAKILATKFVFVPDCLDMFFKILLLQVAFRIFSSITIFFLLICLLLQYVALFQSRN